MRSLPYCDVDWRIMLARTPAALKKRRYRRRRRDGMIAPHVQFHEHDFAEALITSKRLTDQQALRRDQLVREAENILLEFMQRWLGPMRSPHHQI